MAKKTFKKGQIVEAYNVLADAKLGKIDTVTDKLKVVDALRVMRPIVKSHNEDLETARETLKPAGLEESQRRLRDNGNVTQVEMVRNTILSNEYGEALNRYVRERLAVEGEVELTPLGKETIDKLIEGNPEWTPGQIMSLIDVLG